MQHLSPEYALEAIPAPRFTWATSLTFVSFPQVSDQVSGAGRQSGKVPRHPVTYLAGRS